MEEIVTKGRKTGQTHAMIESMKQVIEGDGRVGVAGCKDPSDILSRLSSLGVEAKADIMEATKPVQLIFDKWGETIGIQGGDKVQTGYVFSKQAH